jgi:hypothetical protein
VQELALSFNHGIVACSQLAPGLLHLTLLTALSLRCEMVQSHDAPLLATALATCTSLQRLEFFVKCHEDGFKEFSNNAVCQNGTESAETIAKVFPALSKLTYLHLSRQLGSRQLPEVLPKLRELRHLHMDDINAWGETIHDEDLCTSIGSLRRLEHLSVADNFLNDVEIGPLLATLSTSLTFLNLEKNRLPAKFPRLAKLKKLRVLNLHFCGITRAVAERFTALTALEKLLADDAQMPPEATETLIAALPKCITHVEIYGSHFPASAAPHLAELKALQVRASG